MLLLRKIRYAMHIALYMMLENVHLILGKAQCFDSAVNQFDAVSALVFKLN